MKKKTLDISYNSKENISGLGLEKRLSNLYPYEFEMDGVKFSSWEGFIQSLKTPDVDVKRELWEKHGYQAWKSGQKISWWEKQEVYWLTEPIDRHSTQYDILITKSYDCLYNQNEEFRKAIKESLPYKIDHSKGKTSKDKTLLTKKEYIEQLERLRKMAKPNRLFNLMNLFK
jgi:hypothetical protein